MPRCASGGTGHLPDFIIGGAMKSATTTLHNILAQHSEVFIPNGEIHFFSVDDIAQHRGFFHRYGSQWAFHDYDLYFDEYRNWYESFFEEASPGQIVGEDSTVYLPSAKAPPRIAELLPDVHLIFLLRDPVDRAYSHYWHSLRTGRETYTFEEALQYGNEAILTRGFYRQQLGRYFQLFPESQITILIFQDFVNSIQDRIDELCHTLGLSHSINLSTIETQRNQTRVPRWPRLLAWQNRVFRSRNARHPQYHLPNTTTDSRTFRDRVLDKANQWLRNLNMRNRSPAPMDPETKSFLQKLYARENRGLSELIGVDLQTYWPYMDS